MLTPEQIDYLVGLLEAVGRHDQQLLHLFLTLIYNNEWFGTWLYDVLNCCDAELATYFIIQAINSYMPFYYSNPQ